MARSSSNLNQAPLLVSGLGLAALFFAACSDPAQTGPVGSGSGATGGTTGTGGSGGAPNAGNTSAAGTPGSGGAGATAGAGVGGAAGSGTGGSAGTGASAGAGPTSCDSIAPGPSPLRRLTTYEYNNTVKDLLGDMSNPGNNLPPQTDSKDNWFGNDASVQSVDDTLIEKYQSIAQGVAERATADAAALSNLHSCASGTLAAADEEACARNIATSLLPRAFRRAVSPADIDGMVTLYRTVRQQSSTLTFSSGVAAMVEAVLQSPEFLYRVELGTEVAGNPAVRRITGREMASRLSYLFFQSMPDDGLFQAADSGALDDAAGVLAKARQLLDDRRSRPMVAFFFDNLLPIPDLAALSRDRTLFPAWSAAIGTAMHTEVQKVLEYEIYDNAEQSAAPYAAGSWPAVLTAPYTFVDPSLFEFYGAGTFAAGASLTGQDFQRVPLNTDQRLGLLTLGGVMAGGTTSNMTNAVLRGSFLLNRVMCAYVELPSGVSPPQIDPYSGKTARERLDKHTADPVCAGCHVTIDAMGLPFELYDAVGRYRSTEHFVDPMTSVAYDTPIDATGGIPDVDTVTTNAVELVRLMATSDSVGSCFAGHWMQFAYGRSIGAEDVCNQQLVENGFKTSGYKVKDLLLGLTQADAFLYRRVE